MSNPNIRVDFLHAIGSMASHKIANPISVGDDNSNTIIYPIGR
jgi:hypothetical protein